MATTQTAPNAVNDEVVVAPSRESEGSPRQREPANPKRRWRQLAGLSIVIVLVCAALVAGVSNFSAGARSSDKDFVYHTVVRGDLPITITERGTLESQDNVQIKCEVDDVPGSALNGTPILWIVENGASVEKGELLVELDSSQHLERLDQQILDTERALAKKTQANIQYDSQREKNRTREMNAELQVQLAELELQQYEDENGGTFQIQLQDIDLKIQEREAELKIAERNLEAVKKLAVLGYKSSGDLAQAELRALERQNAHEQQRARREELVKYSYEKQKLRLAGELESAKRALKQVRRDNEARLAQARVARDTADRAYEKEEERLADFRQQVEKCKIYAPQSGMVAYAVESGRWGQQNIIEEGAAIRNLQHILSLPDLSRMQVQISLHESVVDLAEAGLSATIRIDAFSDLVYSGTVKSVAVLPDQGGWLSTGAKVYTAIVAIDGEVDKLKPGMTAVAEINVEVLHDVLSVPIQALVQRGNETWCYVSQRGSIERRVVDVGKSNDKFVEIRAGIEAGDSVVLNPSAVLELSPDAGEEISPESPSNSQLEV